MQSLYDMCLGVISSEFAAIDKRFVKDLPKHILEQILYKLNPFYLEALENEEFLNLRGISTDSLWKTHCDHRFKFLARSSFNLEQSNYKSWRTHYFARHFHMLIHPTVLSPDKIYEKRLQDSLNKELHRALHQTSCNLENVVSPDLNDVVDLCIKHLTSIRINNNATCVYLAQHSDILMRLAPVLERLQVGQLWDDSVEALIKILDVLLKNKLRSFSLSDSKVENVEKLRALFQTLAESQSLDTECFPQLCTQLKDEYDEPTILLDSGNCSVGGFAKEYKKDESTASESNCNDFKIIDNKVIFSSASKPGNSSLCNELDRNIADSMYNIDSDECFIKQDDQEKRVDDDCLETEDDLYEDIFSRRTTSQGTWLANNTASTRVKSSQMRKLWQTQLKPELTSNHMRPHCLTDLKLSSCLMNNASLKVFSEELTFFLSLRSLGLCEVGSCFFPAMNDLITNVKELVIHGSLRHLVFENKLTHDRHFEMFCDMIILFCERCQSTQTRKGLWTLHVANVMVSSTDRLGEVLGTCSICEQRVTVNPVDPVRTTDPIPRAYITTGIENLYMSFYTGQPSAAVLTSSLLRNRSLRRFSLPCCRLKTDDISNIFDCISGSDIHECNTAMEKLDLRDNLFEAIQNNSLFNLITKTHLVHLDLSYCGLEVIPDDVVLALSSNKFLKVFKIAGNRLGDAGVTQLSKVFTSAKKISVLNTLDLSCNRLSSSSLLDFANVLTAWPVKLHEICINGNPRVDENIVRECLEEFFDVVIMNPYVCFMTTYMAFADYLSEM